MTIELLVPYFGFTKEMWKLAHQFRRDIFEAAAVSDMQGLIFTYVWAFDLQSDWDYVDEMCSIFEKQGADVCLVELEADLEERIARNKTPHRLAHKPSKRDVERSERDLRLTLAKYRLNSEEGEIQRENYIKVNNTNMSAEEVAKIIQHRFQL